MTPPPKYGPDAICPILRPPQLYTGISYGFESVIFGIKSKKQLRKIIFIVIGGLVLKICPLLGGLSFRDSLFAPAPSIFRIAATRKRNGVEISNSQNFLVSMIYTSILSKKRIHDIGCTPLFELG